MSRSNIPLSNLRAVVIVIVVAFHSVLPYLASQPVHPYPFDAAPYGWVAFPIIDQRRWFGFDLFCAWQDVSLMSLMFFLAGLLTPASLSRKGTRKYLVERLWRIGVPFLFAVAILSPAAYLASYRLTAADPDPAAFWEHWRALPMWPSGPAWFLWQLVVLNALAAGLYALVPRWVNGWGRAAASLADRPLGFFLALTTLSVLAYVPLALLFTPWEWTYLGPFSFQLSRPLHYALYFFAAFAIGIHGCDHGLLRVDGPLARNWLAWLIAAILGFASWGALTSLTLPDFEASPPAYRLAAAFAFPVACATGVLCLLASCLRLMRARSRVLDSLSLNAYSIYLVHYVIVVWLQYALFDASLGAIAKAAIVFAAGLALSWAVSAGLTAPALRHPEAGSKNMVADQPR
jgi:peptidoglycan/LPS O-acetylase OafA/YrhL